MKNYNGEAMKRKNYRVLRILSAAISLVLAGLAFSGLAGKLSIVLHAQFGAAIMRCFAAFSIGALSVVLAIALITLVFGRFYCSVLCPLGIIQDVVGWLSRRKGTVTSNYVKTRYAIAGVVFGLFACGWTTGFLLLDPYSNFGRMAGSFTVGGMIPLVAIIILALWKKRLYCTTICPVGTLLGLVAKFGLFRLGIYGKCVKCGKCVKVCPAGCIEPQNGILDNERCVRCMNCVSACPLDAISFKLLKVDVEPVQPSRRAFLIQGGILLAGLAVGVSLSKAGLDRIKKWLGKTGILPPGAGDKARFAAKCTSCQLCVANCPEKIIVPAPGGDGPVSLDLSRGACNYSCHRCSTICPTGAIMPLTLEAKRKTKIAEAVFDATKCLVFQQGEKCGKCAAACPAKAIVLRKSGAPRPVDLSLCIGCGACQDACPVNAMTVHEIDKQITLGE